MTTELSAAAELDELTITIVVDNATDTLSSIGPGIPQLPEIAYLLGGIPSSGQHDGHDCTVVFDQLCVACHGFSALATSGHTVGRDRHRSDGPASIGWRAAARGTRLKVWRWLQPSVADR